MNRSGSGAARAIIALAVWFGGPNEHARAQECEDRCAAVLSIPMGQGASEERWSSLLNEVQDSLCESRQVRSGFDASLGIPTSSGMLSLGVGFTNADARAFCRDYSGRVSDVHRERLIRWTTDQRIVETVLRAWQDCQRTQAQGVFLELSGPRRITPQEDFRVRYTYPHGARDAEFVSIDTSAGLTCQRLPAPGSPVAAADELVCRATSTGPTIIVVRYAERGSPATLLGAVGLTMLSDEPSARASFDCDLASRERSLAIQVRRVDNRLRIMAFPLDAPARPIMLYDSGVVARDPELSAEVNLSAALAPGTYRISIQLLNTPGASRRANPWHVAYALSCAGAPLGEPVDRHEPSGPALRSPVYSRDLTVRVAGR